MMDADAALPRRRDQTPVPLGPRLVLTLVERRQRDATGHQRVDDDCDRHRPSEDTDAAPPVHVRGIGTDSTWVEPSQPLASAQLLPNARFTSSGTRNSAAPAMVSVVSAAIASCSSGGTSSSTSSWTWRIRRLRWPPSS